MINLFKIVCSHFLRYSEDIRNPKKIFKWNCEKQNNFIEKGRGNDYVYLENRPKKIWGLVNNSQKLCKHLPAAHVSTAFLVLPNFQSCFYNSIETRYMFSTLK